MVHEEQMAGVMPELEISAFVKMKNVERLV